MLSMGVLAGVFVYCVYAIGRCFFRVNQGAVVVLLGFGAALKDGGGQRLRTYGPGLHLKWPWQVAREVPVMEQSLELSGEEGGQSAMAADGTVLRFDSLLRFTPQEAELEKYLFDMKAPRDHITGLFACLLRNEIADLRPDASGAADYRSGGSYGLIRRQRRELNSRIERFCQKELARRYGVRFSAVDLTDILPPDELADALNAVMHAEAEADAAYSLAEAECQQRIIAAEQGVRIAKEKGRAAEEEIRVLSQFLTELHAQGTLAEYVARRRTEVLSQAKSLYLRS